MVRSGRYSDGWEARYQTARRAATGRNVLGVLAVVFLAGFGYWWYLVWASVLSPAGLLSPESVLTVIVSVVYTVVLPLFWSMLIPNSPAGRLLQKQTWALPGQVVTGALAILLTGVAVQVYGLWLDAHPMIDSGAAVSLRDAGMYYPLLLAMLTGSIFVPALVWSATTPEQLIALLESARIAKRLEQQYALEDMAFKAAHARFAALVNADMTSMTVAEFGERAGELAAILAAGQRHEARRYQALAQTFRHIYGVELAGAENPEQADQALLSQYRYVQKLLTNTAAQHTDAATYAQEVVDSEKERPARTSAQRPDAENAVAVVMAPPQCPAAARSAPQRYSAEYQIARDNLGDYWTVRQLSSVLNVAERTARDVHNAWKDQGLVISGRINGQWRWAEEA